MQTTSNAESLIHDLVEVRLRQAQLRYTPGRRTIVEILSRGSRPMSISEIEREAPRLPRSSAYRHLVDLQGVGAVRSITASGDFTHFELSEDLTEHHHHLLCVRCGAIQDVTPSDAFELAIKNAVNTYARRTGFAALSHSLDVVGHCATCQ